MKEPITPAHNSLPPSLCQSSSPFLSFHVVLPECLNRLISIPAPWDQLLREHTRTKVGGVLDVDARPPWIYYRAVKGGLQDKRFTFRSSEDWHVQFLSINRSSELISHQRLLNVLLYHSLAKILDKLPESADKVILITSWTKSIHCSLQHVLCGGSKGAWNFLFC